MRFPFFTLVVFLFSVSLSAQNPEYSSDKIADSLKQNANAVVRLDQIDIIIASQRSMTIKNKRVVTVLNENGQGAVHLMEYYSKGTTVKNIQTTFLDASGNLVKKIKRKDFTDYCATDGGTVFSDSRVLFYNYTPINYPFTAVYESEVETSTTAFIPQWQPLRADLVSLEKCILNVNYPNNLGFKKKEFNFSRFKIEKTVDNDSQLSYTVNAIPAQKYEEQSPAYIVYPKVMMGLELFHLEGVDGYAKTWKEYGQWYADKILTGTAEIPEGTKLKIKNLIGTETDPLKKARIVYKYLQEKSRYVSIQVGIGGWKPMLATDVDRLGYGDCKALSNYTKSLLNVVGVPSYLTLLYGDGNKHNIEADMVSMQGNHMILSIPDGDNYVFLECTSQDNPFGFQANFTDDRDVVIIKPDGGEIVRTKTYENKDNAQVSKGKYVIAENGDFSGEISMISTGTQYGQKYHLETMQPTEKEKHYKDYWDNISNLKIEKTSFANDKEKISFAENVAISAVNYGSITNNKMMFVVNAFNPHFKTVQRIRNRKNPFDVPRGYYDVDEIAIALPAGFTIESLPNAFELNTKFGEYKIEFIKKDALNLVYKRSILIKKGLYANTEYEEYRLFMDQISRHDNSKIVLAKKL
jgi:hypothetical protein